MDHRQPIKTRVFSTTLILPLIVATGCLATSATQGNTSSTVELSTTASPERQKQGLAIATAFEDWMTKHRVRGGSIAVSFQGSPVISKGIRRDANKPYPVASQSKAITAVCLQSLLNQQGKTVSLSLSEVIPALLSQFPPADNRLGSVTLAQLIGHNSGIHARYHRDFLVDQGNFDKPQMREQFQSLVKLKLTASPGSGYHYNNANYLLLGLAIEALSDGDYEQVCRELILDPIGITAALHPQWRVMSSWGGWEISSVDYLKFLNAYFANNRILGKAPETLGVNTQLKPGVNYNLGILTRSVKDGYRFWHVGSWRWRGMGRDDQFGAYFVTLEDGLMISINYSSHAQDDKLQDLEKRLFVAIRGQ